MNVCLGRAWLTIVITMKLIVSLKINKNVRSGNIYVLFYGKTVCNGYKSTFTNY